MDFPKQGKLNEGLFAAILINIHSSRFTGTVGLTKEEFKKVISFQGGRPVSSRSNVVKESLGGMLVSKGKISEADRENLLADLKAKPEIQLGELLVAKRYVTNFELDDLIKEQLAERIKQSLFWESGDYKIVEGKIAEKSFINLGKSIPEIIYEASKNPQNEANIKKMLPDESKPVLAGGNYVKVEEIRPTGKELAVFKMINGTKSIGEIISATKAEEKIVKGFIFALLQLGLVNVASESSPQRKIIDDKPKVEIPKEQEAQANLSEASKKLYESIKEKAKEIEGKNFFEYFGADENTGTDKIKMEYFSFAKTNHPDRLPKDFTPQMRKEGEELFSKVTDAYNIITDENKKSQYLEKLRLEAQGIKQSPDQIVESEIEYQKGNILLKKADFGGAIKHYKRAITLFSEETEYYFALGWAFFRKGAKRKDNALISKAKVEIERALQKKPEADHAYLNLGHISKFEKNIDKAKHYYSKAVEINPGNLEAASELRLLTSRGGKVKKSGVKGIFNKKN